MDVTEDNVQMLMNMGFPSEQEIRRALRLSKNDLSEAVAILTNERSTNLEAFDSLDVEMQDEPRPMNRTISTQGPPPDYNEVVDVYDREIPADQGSDYSKDSTSKNSKTAKTSKQENKEEENELEFPVANLYELENRVFTESWSIPYKKEESLGKCLISATKLAAEGLSETDDHCRNFLNNCMPECFQKLMTARAVQKWNNEIQEGIYDMLHLLMNLITTRIKHDPVPIKLLEVLALVFDPDTEFHIKNKTRKPEKAWEEKLGAGQTYTSIPAYKDTFGFLTNMINKFADQKGIEFIKEKLVSQDQDAPSMAALLQPLGNCAEFLNGRVVQPILSPGMQTAVQYVKALDDNDLKDKKTSKVCEMLASMKLLCLHMWPNDVNKIDDLRLEIVLRMLRSPHFNARMNALKQVTNLIEDKQSKTSIPMEKLSDWLVQNQFLSVALEGNIDQAQYCDKIKNIVDFLGERLSIDELTKIWKMQNGQHNLVIDNIHSIIVAAAVNFDHHLREHLFKLVSKSWELESEKSREKLLYLIGRIGKDTRIQNTTNGVLELLWDLAHLPSLSTYLIEKALEEHLAILNDSYMVKEQVKRNYVNKCVEDIKEGKWVLPAIKQLHQITKNAKSALKAERNLLPDKADIVRNLTSNIMKFHQMAVQSAQKEKVKLSPDVLVDGRFSHNDYVTTHLDFLKFVLGSQMDLPLNRACEIWNTLMINSDACEWDKETCFKWFKDGIGDLDQDSQSKLFQREFLKLLPGKLSEKGFECFQCFFEKVNLNERRLKESGKNLLVDKTDLIGMDFLWEICLNTKSVNISEDAVTLLINMSYTNLSYRHKKDPATLHRKFIDECYSRLEIAMMPLGGSVVAQLLCDAARILKSCSVPTAVLATPSPSRSANLLNIERLLMIAERYVTTVEEAHTSPRTILPHTASFQGQPLNLYISCEAPKTDFNIRAHSNETVGSLKHKVAGELKQSYHNVQIVVNDDILNKDQKLLHQIGIEDNHVISARATGFVPASGTDASSTILNPATRLTFDLEQEKMLPGVLMSQNALVFRQLYALDNLEEPRITNRARQLLKLIPTDPSVLDSLDALGRKTLRQPSPEPPSPRLSPRGSPRKYTPAPIPTPSSSCNKDMLKSLFDACASEMSTFRVLYNLEVLSGRLMPTTKDPATLQSARNFCEDFLNADGLSLVVHVLQRDAIPNDVDYETRQGCYAIALQLLRFILCGQGVLNEPFPASPRRSSIGSSGALGGSLDSQTPSLEITPAAVSRAIQTMSINDFTETVACFMRVSWAAAAGKLHLASASQGLKETSSASSGYSTGGSSSRSRQSSTGSTTSSGSESEAICLHPGLCVKQSSVSTKDTLIAQEGIELLVTCLQLRSNLLATFYDLPCVGDFIIDILLGSPQDSIRDTALDQFYLLSQTDIMPEDMGHQVSPPSFMLGVLLKARLPLWVSSSSTRGATYRLLKQCTQYFDLRCRLLGHLTLDDQKRLTVDVQSMLEDEIGWLHNFVPSEVPKVRETDNILITGHLKLIKTLISCEGVDKKEIGKTLVNYLIHDFLFPASRLMKAEGVTKKGSDTSMLNFNPKCSNSLSRIAAYELLEQLADGCLDNLQEICAELVNMHHHAKMETGAQWEYMPPVDSRAACGYVGLKNGGATCYMNSVIQQLYMTPGIYEAVLGIDEDQIEEESVFYQMQQAFGHLLESKLQYYVPERFWKVFKLWGQPVNIREQQDAFDFYQATIDQIDEQLKKMGKDPIFKRKFQGVYSDQKICKDCPHRYEREEVFFALNVTVKNATLQDSLAQFVKGELLEGDNAYFCEKCGEKRNTIKRMCIKTLPPVLCIQLKRFDYDWETNRALKFDDYFKFPWMLDMEPYTAEGMERLENERNEQEPPPSPGGTMTTVGSSTPDSLLVNTAAAGLMSQQINYELVGVVVHSGQANAGHYYSYIKDRRGNYLTNPNKSKWFKFNDTVVEEFDMNETNLEAECFGGTYRPKVYETSNTCSYPEERQRYWNGYLLFYEKVEDTRTPISAKKSRVSPMHPTKERPSKRNSDSIVELTELVHKGEKKGLFSDKMPSQVQQVVREENLRFMKNRDVYDLDYFKFIKKLVKRNSIHDTQDNFTDLSRESVKLAIKFLFNTYLRTKRKLRTDMDEWVTSIEKLLDKNKDSCMWLVEYLGTEGKDNIKPFLLECPTKEIRVAFSKVLQSLIDSFLKHGGIPTMKSFDSLISTLLSMLDKDVPDNCKQSSQYFELLQFYVSKGTKTCPHMFGKQAFFQLIHFLLGNPTGSSRSADQESNLRRWSSMQAREFGPLHSTLAILILNCDLTQYRTDDCGKQGTIKPDSVTPKIFLKMSQDMYRYVYGKESSNYVREIVIALREVSGSLPHVEDMLCYCGFANHKFTMNVVKNIMTLYTSAPANELKSVFAFLLRFLLLEDSLQLQRLQCIIDGYVDDHDVEYKGMLAVIRSNTVNDSNRSYQCVKFLVTLVNKSTMAKNYLMQSRTKLEWAVNWLKKKMSEQWTPTTNISNDDSTSKTFQRTISAQDTLDGATRLIVEFSNLDHSEMETTTETNETQETDTQDTVAYSPGSSQDIDEKL